MFKFMKSKKGFSLVELMIVVVIMAILVAVAVPIFNSVTGNSRAKTCIDNQRTIISTINTDLLSKSLTKTETFSVTYDGKVGNYTKFGSNNTIYKDAAALKAVFQTVPYCPVDNSEITVEIVPATDSTPLKITTACVKNANDPSNPHSLSKGS